VICLDKLKKNHADYQSESSRMQVTISTARFNMFDNVREVLAVS